MPMNDRIKRLHRQLDAGAHRRDRSALLQSNERIYSAVTGRCHQTMKYTSVFIILGSAMSCIGYDLGGWWNLLHWFSLSLFALALGHAGLGHHVFGKSQDGQIPIWSKILHLPYMLLSHFLWHMVIWFSRENASDAIMETLVLGRRLRPNEVPSDFENYIDLTTEMEDAAAIRNSKNYICLPILDAGVPCHHALQAAISKMKPGTTYVHCAQGHGRSGLFALALLVESRAIKSFDEGMALLHARRPGIQLNKAQKKFIEGMLLRITSDDPAITNPKHLHL